MNESINNQIRSRRVRTTYYDDVEFYDHQKTHDTRLTPWQDQSSVPIRFGPIKWYQKEG